MTFTRDRMMLTKRTTKPRPINIAGVIVLVVAGVAIATAIAAVVMLIS
jgi:hypothetical protein